MNRFLYFALLVACVAAGAFAVTAAVSAHAPHPELDFSIAIDTNGDFIDDCATSGGPTACNVPLGSSFAVKLYLYSIGTVPGYDSYDATILFAGVSAKYNSDPSFWPDCAGPLYAPPIIDRVGWGCVVGQLDPPSTYTGLIGTTQFNCTQSGTVSMLRGEGNTQIVGSGYEQHGEAQGTTETLTINCVEPVGGAAIDIARAVSGDDHVAPMAEMAWILVLVLAGASLARATFAAAARRP